LLLVAMALFSYVEPPSFPSVYSCPGDKAQNC